MVIDSILKDDIATLWHDMISHLNYIRLSEMQSKNVFTDLWIKVNIGVVCVGCQYEKMH